MKETILYTNNLRKSFAVNKKTITAVDGVDLEVKKGEIFGFLGPNGAGKTTTLRMLTTLLPIDAGDAVVAGNDVRKHPEQVRRRIGYVSQAGGGDGLATGREDLLLQGRLYGLSKEKAQRRTDELATILDLQDFIDRRVSTYSGGQRRRLDVALGIVHQPEVLFLDEPTTGLDPQNRANLWNQIRKLRDAGTTVFLTTHYLEEADALSDRLTIMDHGKIVVTGTPHQLKQQISGDAIVIKTKRSKLAAETILADIKKAITTKESRIEGEAIHIYVEDGTKTMPTLFNLLEAKGVELTSVSISQPSLDDVFLKQTGRSLRDGKHTSDRGEV